MSDNELAELAENPLPPKKRPMKGGKKIINQDLPRRPGEEDPTEDATGAAADPANIELVPLTELHLDKKNARRGDVAAITDSLRQFGQHRPIVAQRETGKIVIGNHMALAMAGLGWSHALVLWVDDSDEEAVRRSLADNLTADRSKWEEEQLKAIIAEIDQPLTIPGLDERTFERLMGEITAETNQPHYPIVPRPGEGYAYVMVVSMDDLDRVWMESVLGVGKRSSWKSDKVGVSRVISVREFRAALNRAIREGLAYPEDQPFVEPEVSDDDA